MITWAMAHPPKLALLMTTTFNLELSLVINIIKAKTNMPNNQI